MGLFNNIFGSKDKPISSFGDFWNWFQSNEREFYKVVKEQGDIEKKFFRKLETKLAELKDGFFYQVGMCDDTTAELILTADSNIKNIVFVEELVEAAVKINGWKFTALMPAQDIKDVSIEMGDLKFSGENLGFYPNNLPGYPDEVDITIVYNDFTKEKEETILNGVYIFLDNFLGELAFANNIDQLKLGNKDENKEPIPIGKLKEYLSWRQSEFLEKYDGARYDTENDQHTMFESTSDSDAKLVIVMNTDLLRWDSKASHPWIATLTLNYDGSKNNGMPKPGDQELYDIIEDEIFGQLKAADGYLNIGRQTGSGKRVIYFACKDFRKPSKTFFDIQRRHAHEFEIAYNIYKDKYWRSFERFNKP